MRYLELVSSLNVELVYIILKSITQFAYIKSLQGDDNDRSTKLRMSDKKREKAAANLRIDEQSGDATLSLDRIKVKNSQAWSNSRLSKITSAGNDSLIEEETVII